MPVKANGNGAAATSASNGGMSTDALAQVMASQRTAPGADGTTAGAAAAKPDNEGHQGGDAAAATTEDLNGLTPEQRAAQAAETAEAARVAALTPAEREAHTAEMARWNALSPEQQAAEEKEWDRREALTPEQRATEDAAAEAAATAAAGPGDEALDLSKVPKLSPEQAKHVGEMFRERIGKAKAKYLGEAEALVATERQARTAAEAERDQFKAQLEQQPRTVPAGESPLANVTTAAHLQKVAADAESVRDWAGDLLIRVKRNPDAVLAELKAAKIELPEESAEAAEEWLTRAERNAERTVRVEVPRREKFLQQQQQFTAQAETRFPFLKDPKSPLYADAMGLLQSRPWLKQEPTWAVAAAVWAKGMAAIRAEDAAGKNGNGNGAAAPRPRTPPPTRVGTRPGGAPRSAAATEARTTEAETKFKSEKSTASLAEYFASQRK